MKLSQVCLEQKCPRGKKVTQTWIYCIVEWWRFEGTSGSTQWRKVNELTAHRRMAAVTEGLPLPFGGNDNCHLATIATIIIIIATIIIIIAKTIIIINMPRIGG